MRIYPCILLTTLACTGPGTPDLPGSGQALRDATQIVMADQVQGRWFESGSFQKPEIALDQHDKDKAIALVGYSFVHDGKRDPPCEIALTYSRQKDSWRLESADQGMPYSQQNCYRRRDR